MSDSKINLQYGAWVGKSTGTTSRNLTYNITDTDGAIGKARYDLTVHDLFEKLSEKVEHLNVNVRKHPYSQWITATSDGQDLNVYAEQSYGWDVGVSFSGDAAQFMAGVFGISLSGSVNASTNVGVAATIHNVPKGYATILEIYDAIIRHTGTANQWNASGFVSQGPYQIDQPDTPAGGVQASALEWRGDGPPPPGGPTIPPTG